jgi:predicted transcriptional regulator
MHRPFLFWGFKSSDQILDSHLGALEREVMGVVWKAGEINVRDACDLLESPAAYTTVMTTMDRLFKKRLLDRRKVGRAFVYTATATRDEMEGAVATELVQSLLQRHGGEPLPILSSLVDAVSDRDRALLDDLERLIREKRRATDREKGR